MIDSPHELEGVRQAGGYDLGPCLGTNGRAGFFVTAAGRDRALLKLVPEDAAGEEQLALWQETAALWHPNLLRLLDFGRAEESGEPFLFAVFEYPDDNLAGALANGPLSEPEGREVFDAVREALAYLHSRDLVHTAVDADHVVAVGSRIKLTSDTLRHAGEEGATPAADLAGLDALFYHLSTGVRPEPESAEAPAAVAEQPERIEAIIEPPAEAVPIPGDAVEPEPSEPVAVLPADSAPAALESAPAAIEPAPAALEPASAALEPALAALEPAAREPAPIPTLALPKRSPALPLLLAAAGAVAIAIVLAVTQKTPAETDAAVIPSPAAPVAAPAVAAKPALPAPAPATVAKQPPVAERKTSAPERLARTGGASRRDLRPGDTWRVVAYTYNRRDQAEHKANTINRLKPGFDATVFAPRGNQAPFFVALGGRMSRAEAAALQRKARAGGLPRDTFVRNF